MSDFPRISHHLCLVSAQTMPNYLPALNDDLRPSRVTLAVTPAKVSQDSAKILRTVFKQRQIEVDELPIPDTTDLADLSDRFVKWLDEHANDDLVLNSTGGTKLMAIAAQEAFRMAGKPVFYVDIDTDRVVWVDDFARTPCRLTRQPSIRTAFFLNGFSVEEAVIQSKIPETWSAFTRDFAQNVRAWGAALGALNFLATDAYDRKSLKADLRLIEGRVPAHWGTLLDKLNAYNLTAYPDTLEFLNENARDFCRGGWLEHYVFRLAKETFALSKDTILMNVIIVSPKRIRNEVDCALFLHNTLYLLECKAKNLKRRSDTGVAVVDDAIYKIAQVTHQQGLRAKSAIVSALPVRDDDKKRAELFKVDIFDNLATIEEKLRGFLQIG